MDTTATVRLCPQCGDEFHVRRGSKAIYCTPCGKARMSKKPGAIREEDMPIAEVESALWEASRREWRLPPHWAMR